MRSYTLSSSTSSSSIENLNPRTIARVTREIRDLVKNPPEGTKIVLDADTGMPSNLGEIMAEIEGPTGTPYESRFFHLKLVLGQDFPSSPPRGFFLTKIYHPNVDISSGAICVNTLKKDWNSTVSLCHVLSIIRCLLIIPFPESSLNDEAGKLFMNSYEEFSRRARLMAGVHALKKSYINDDTEETFNDLNNKASKENKSITNRGTATSLSSSSSVLKQSNTSERKKKECLVQKKVIGALDKKSKKKSLKRL
mmetsp:Transcript_15971/g.22753  ORF Transcript_15971/g.22753 Transcript_15971/m.22753 type:complete len:252 (+) Transcript_15971:120-875(+)